MTMTLPAGKSKPFTSMGFVIELNCYLIRDNKDGTLSLWRKARYITPRPVIILNGIELEFVMTISNAYRVIDSEFNRKFHTDDIGRIYVDADPIKADIKEI